MTSTNITTTATDDIAGITARTAERIIRAFYDEEIAGLKLAAQARAVAMVGIAIWLFSLMRYQAWYFIPFLTSVRLKIE